MCSSAVLGGGIGPRTWILNAQVPGGYPRLDPDTHLAEIAAAEALAGPGAALMTAADVTAYTVAADEGVTATVTSGLGVRGWAADPAAGIDGPPPPGTVNIVVTVPVALSDAALVNAVATATEAKVQALLDAGLDCSGTPTDAVCVAAPEPGPGAAAQPFVQPALAVGIATRQSSARCRARRRIAATLTSHRPAPARGAADEGTTLS